MNRDILFRGQTRKRGEKVNMAGNPVDGIWVYGGAFQGINHSIIYGTADLNNIKTSNIDKYVVHTDTLGQYTGLPDKNGIKIFEGDIIRGKTKRVFRVDYNSSIASFVAHALDEQLSTPCMNLGTMRHYEVVGNIYDNPELLGNDTDCRAKIKEEP